MISKTITNFFYHPLSAKAAYLFSIFFSVVFVLLFYSIDSLLGQSNFLMWGDPAQHNSGWLFFKNDEWHFPLTKTFRLNYPEGASIIFTDSIPLMALLLKPFAAFLPEHFQYIGLWQGLVFVFQAVAATYLIRTLQQKTLIALLAALFFTLTFPPLLFRSSHTSLMTQGVLLLSIAYYWQAYMSDKTFQQIFFRFMIMLLLIILINQYIAFMVLIFWGAVCIDYIKKNKKWQLPIIFSAILAAVLLVEMYCVGFFDSASKPSAGGFGHYSMNLLAPFLPTCYANMPHAFCSPDATGGQYEGLNYLGIGAWIIVISSIILCTSQWKIYKPMLGLQIALLCFVILALSNKIYLGHYLILELPGMEIFGFVRSSGRFFWPVGYCIIFFGLLALLQYSKKSVVILIILTSILFQAYETKKYYDVIQQLRHSETEKLIPLVNIFKQFKGVNFYPAYLCGYDSHVISMIQYQASYAGVTFNTAVLARKNFNCDEKNAIFNVSDMKNGYLYMMPKNDNLLPPPAFQQGIKNNNCTTYHMKEDFLLCAKDKKSAWFANYLKPFEG